MYIHAIPASVACALFALVLLAATAWARNDTEAVDSPRWTRQFDGHFRKYSKRYFGPYFNWQWFKAQAIVESRLDPDARSAAGAVGIMQVMPQTYAEIRGRNPHFQDLKDPKWNIAAGVYYDRQLFRKLREPVPDTERILLMFAGYNAGLGGARRAYKRTGKTAPSWPELRRHLPRETRTYVNTIYDLVEGGEPRDRGSASWLKDS